LAGGWLSEFNGRGKRGKLHLGNWAGDSFFSITNDGGRQISCESKINSAIYYKNPDQPLVLSYFFNTLPPPKKMLARYYCGIDFSLALWPNFKNSYQKAFN
jgi:hypothetical protein